MKEEEIVRKINKNQDNSIRFKVTNGHKKFKQGMFWLGNLKKRIILLDDVPLVMLSEEKFPVSSAAIKLMKGRSAIVNNIQQCININKSIVNIEEGFDILKPFLSLFNDGDYELKEAEMIPTDGEENCFWNCSGKSRYYPAAADIYYRGKFIKGYPKFLIPSEGIECLDMNLVEEYRKRIRQGEELVGVAFELKGFMALMLDGHNKAAAAYLEGKTIKCLLIRSNKKNYEVLNIDEKQLLGETIRNLGYINNCKPKKVYPDFVAVAITGSKKVDISAGRINKLLNFQGNHPIEDLKEILYYLSIYDTEKAKRFCFYILQRRELQLVWNQCIKYLSKCTDREVEVIAKENRLEFKGVV